MYFYAIDGDDIGAKLEKLAFSNELDAISELSQTISNCLDKLRLYFESYSARIIFCGGDSLLAVSEHRINLTMLELSFDSLSFSAGIGRTCCDATLALKKAKGLGKMRLEELP
jgi:GTP cyclohydrolase III